MISNMVRSTKIIVELFTFLYCLAELYGQKFRLSIHTVVLIILDLFLLTGIYSYGFPAYLRSLLYVALFLYSLIYYGESIKKTLVNCLLAALILTVMQLLFCMPSYFLNIRTYENQETFGLVIIFASFLFIMVCGKKFKLENLSNFFLKKEKFIYAISILVLMGLGFNVYQIWRKGYILGEQYFQLIYFLLLLGFTVGEWQKSRMDAEKKKLQLEMNSLYYDAYDQLIMLVRERQHDTKNHINAILSMIYTTNNYEELVEKQKEYCDFVIEQNEETRLLLASGNPLVAGFLYSKMRKADDKQIIVTYQINMKKFCMPFPEYELVDMIGILFDNAVEALLKAEEQEKRMFVSIQDGEDKLEIVVANVSGKFEEDITQRFFEAGYSSKGSERGIGLSKLKHMVCGRNGEITVSNEIYDERNYLTFTIRFLR